MTKARDIADLGDSIINDANNNVALGDGALDDASLSGSNNVAIGEDALAANTSASYNTAVGYQTLDANSTGYYNVGVGAVALGSNTTGISNTAIGTAPLGDNSTGSYNTAIGTDALRYNTTANNNTAVGYQAGYSNTTNASSSFFGHTAGYSTTGTRNTFLGQGSGYWVSSGAKNTILGPFDGNQGGLDIRTSSNNIVLSDGDGNPRLYITDSNTVYASGVYAQTSASAANVFVQSNGALVRSTSSLRYKNTVNDATHGLTELMTLRSVTYKGNNDGDTIFGGLIAEEVHDAGLTEFVQYNDSGEPDALAYGNMVSLCIKAIQEQQATITALEARITALEAN
jgi:hypothetical protein